MREIKLNMSKFQVEKYRNLNSLLLLNERVSFNTIASYKSQSYKRIKFETEVTIDESAGTLGLIIIGDLLEVNIQGIAPSHYSYIFQKFSFRKNVGLTIKGMYNGEEYTLTIYNK